MDNDTAVHPAFSEHPEQDVVPRKRLSPWGVLSLIGGLASSAALMSTMLWPIAGVGLLISVLSVMYFVRHGKEVSGERLAAIGLALSLVFVTAAPTHEAIRQYHVAEQATDIGQQWLEYLKYNQPYNAYESFMQPVPTRRPLNETLVEYYESDPNLNLGYQNFLTSPLVRALASLGQQATIQHYQTEKIEQADDGADVVTEVFAVTYYDHNQKTSFFVRLIIERRFEAAEVRGLWQVKSFTGGIKPSDPPSA